MGFLLTESVALEAPKGPHWVCRGPLALGSAENSGLECNYESHCVLLGMGTEGADDGAEWRRKREAVGERGLKRSQEMEEENQAQWPKMEECAGVWAESWGSRAGPLRKVTSHPESRTLGLSK